MAEVHVIALGLTLPLSRVSKGVTGKGDGFASTDILVKLTIRRGDQIALDQGGRGVRLGVV